MNKKCLICGINTEKYLCNSCRKTTNIETLCFEISEYKTGNGIKPLWDELAEKAKEEGNVFKDVVFDLTVDMPSPLAEMLLIKCLAKRNKNAMAISEYYRDSFEEFSAVCLNSDEIQDKDKNYIKALYLSLYQRNHDWNSAEECARELYENAHDFPKEAFWILANFYTCTRRYDISESLINEGIELYGACEMFAEYYEDCDLRATGKKKHYLPQGAEKQENYRNFLSSLGIEVEAKKPPNGSKSLISDADYPEFVFTSQSGFTSFVAYDTETTGFGSKTDCIVEIGAIKVVDGVVVDEERFRFQTLIKPYAGVRGMTSGAASVTGIVDSMLVDAPNIVEVFNAFADFIGDNILVGFNNQKFDSRMLRRAGRYAGRVITNKQFDVWCMAKRMGICGKLGEIADSFGIVNPNAHRAYADAWTTAKVYLKLLEMKGK